MATRHRFRIADKVRTVTVGEDGDLLAVAVDEGDAVLVDATSSGIPGHISLIIDGAPVRAYVTRDGQSLRVTVDGLTVRLDPASARGRGRGPLNLGAPAGQIRAIAGVVVEVRVGVGDRIEAGDTVAVIEAMKMQNEVQAPMDGTVTIVHAIPGERIEADELVLEYEPLESPDDGQ